jgi:hypothetical protein
MDSARKVPNCIARVPTKCPEHAVKVRKWKSQASSLALRRRTQIPSRYLSSQPKFLILRVQDSR